MYDREYNYSNIPPLEVEEGSGLIITSGSPPSSKLRGLSYDTGITTNRPTSPKNGCMYFDETLGHPIWYNGTTWVDSTGTGV